MHVTNLVTGTTPGVIHRNGNPPEWQTQWQQAVAASRESGGWFAECTDEEILRVCNKENPSGTTLGWCSVVRSDAKEPKRNPVACAQEPGRTHFLVAC